MLVDVGQHDVVRQYLMTTTRAYRALQLDQADPAPEAFDPSTEAPLFVDIDNGLELEAEELDDGWLTFLATEQQAVHDRLLDGICRHTGRTGPFVAYIRGGAGTGKTAVLLSLALALRHRNIQVHVQCSEAVTKHLTGRTGVDVRQLQAGVARGGVLLVDDPAASWQITTAIHDAENAGACGVVVAFDPLQWREKRLRQGLDSLPVPQLDHRLSTCYRQASGVAQQAMDMVSAIHERSSWRSAAELVREERALLRELEEEYLRNLDFIKPGGRIRTVRTTRRIAAVRDEAASLRERRWDLWKDMPALLILEDQEHGVALSKEEAHEMCGISRRVRPLSAVETYRGLDFQATWLFLSADFYDRIQQGKPGLSAVEWAAMRDLHVAFTRAKDETTLFLV